MSAERLVNFVDFKVSKSSFALAMQAYKDQQNLNKDSKQEHSNSIEAIFSKLPLAEGVNISLLEPLLKDQNPNLAQQLIHSRYEFLDSLNKEQGVEEPLVLDFDLAHALADREYFDAKVEGIRHFGQVLQTAVHEMGHGHVAHHVGRKVPYMSVIPSGHTLGVTYSVVTKHEDPYTGLVNSAAVALGGILEAEKQGYEPKGGGSDMAKVNALARLAHLHYSHITIDGFIRDAQNIANAALNTSGNSAIMRDARRLAYEGQRAA